MRICSLFLFALIVVLPSLGSAADEFPKRKAGLWEVTIASDGRGEQRMRHCIDEVTDVKLQQMAAQVGKECTQEMHREGQGYVGTAECAMMGTKIRSKTTFKGDFSSSYEGDVFATYDPPLMGKKESKTKITAKWLGACEAGQRPGDVIMPGGQSMNIDMLQGMRQKQPPK